MEEAMILQAASFTSTHYKDLSSYALLRACIRRFRILSQSPSCRYDMTIDWILLPKDVNKRMTIHGTIMLEVEDDTVWSWWKVSIPTLPLRRDLIYLCPSSSVMSYKQICMPKPTEKEGSGKRETHIGRSRTSALPRFLVMLHNFIFFF